MMANGHWALGFGSVDPVCPATDRHFYCCVTWNWNVHRLADKLLPFGLGQGSALRI